MAKEEIPPGVSFLAPGEGQLGSLIRAKDWSGTTLGPRERWPEALSRYVEMVLALPTPAIIFWGEQQAQLYNDGYALIMGPRHPRYLGATYKECWPDTYPLIYPWMRRVLDSGEKVTVDRTHIPVTRKGYQEDAWFTFTFSPLRDDDGRIAGILQIVTEVTESVLAERALIENEERNAFNRLFTRAPIAVCVLEGPEHRYSLANEAYERLVGGKRDFLGKTVREALPELKGQGFYELLDNVYRTGEPYVGREAPVQVVEHGVKRDFYCDFIYHPRRDLQGRIDGIVTLATDVTEKVLERKAAENERENFRRLFKQTPEMLVTFGGPDHVFEFVNEAHVNVLGFDATGKTAKQAQPQSTKLHEILDHVYRTGETISLREAASTFHGEPRHFNLTYSPRYGSDGAVNGVMALGSEVSDFVNSARRLEQAFEGRTKQLRESESFLDSVIENLPNMVFVKDAAELKFVRFNRAGEELLGLPRAALIGKSDHDFFPPEQAKHFVAKDREVLASGHVLDIPEEPIETKQGRRILHTRKIPIRGSGGKAEFLLGISEDITDAKRAEAERLRSIREQAAMEERQRETERASFLAEASTLLARSLNYAQTLRDLAALVVPVMADWCTVTMAREGAEHERVAAVHRDPAKAALVEELSAFRQVSSGGSAIDRVIRSGAPVFLPLVVPGQLEATAENERHLSLMRELGCESCIVVPILSREKPIGAISIMAAPGRRPYNESDLAVAAELGRRAGIAIENASLYESVRRAVETRDEFMSVASHELKTPLTSLKLQAQIRDRDIRRGNFARFEPGNLPKLVADDEKQLDRLIRLVEDMLDVSRINSGRIEFSFEEFDLRDLVRETTARFAPQFELAGMRLSLSAGGPVLGRWDRFRIEQVLANLLSNALKYGDRKPVDVAVAKQEGEATLSVHDRGLGIAPRDHARIFGQFERAVAGSNISGLGLGLFISRKIVEGHGGAIRVESEVGKGATFSVHLPLSGRA